MRFCFGERAVSERINRDLGEGPYWWYVCIVSRFWNQSCKKYRGCYRDCMILLDKRPRFKREELRRGIESYSLLLFCEEVMVGMFVDESEKWNLSRP